MTACAVSLSPQPWACAISFWYRRVRDRRPRARLGQHAAEVLGGPHPRAHVRHRPVGPAAEAGEDRLDNRRVVVPSWNPTPITIKPAATTIQGPAGQPKTPPEAVVGVLELPLEPVRMRTVTMQKPA
jgi:hypothetical protein